LLTLALVLTLTIIYFRDREFFKNIAGYGYLGAFVTSVVLNAAILLPVSNTAVIAALGALLPMPWLLGIVAGTGAAIGEMTGYVAGRSSRCLLANNKMYGRVEGWVKKWGWFAIFLLSVFPFAFDVAGVISGALRMPAWRFFTACWLGRTVCYVFVATTAYLGIRIIPWLN
jgi:membrane protein YqaA with SNARE-associated domain